MSSDLITVSFDAFPPQNSLPGFNALNAINSSGAPGASGLHGAQFLAGAAGANSAAGIQAALGRFAPGIAGQLGVGALNNPMAGVSVGKLIGSEDFYVVVLIRITLIAQR